MNRKFFYSFFMVVMALFATACSSSSSAGGKVISFTTDIQEDASYAVYCAIEGKKAGEISKIEFEKGTYHFYPEKAKEKFCYISNHNDVLARIAFDLEDLEGVTIEGNGSTFIFHGCMIPFWIEDSKDVTVQNLSIDYSEPFHAELVVVATNAKAKTIDFSISEDFPYEIRNDELFFSQPYYKFNIGQTLYYNAKTGGTDYANNSYSLTTWGRPSAQRGVNNFKYKYKYDRNDIGIRSNGANGMKAKQLKPGLVRLFNQRKAMPPIGSVLTAKGNQGENRFAPAFKCNNVTNFYATNVTIYHAGGMGFLFENCDTAMLEKCKIIPAKGRIISTTADATHFVGCRGKVTLKDCVFHSQLDDAMNVHGAYQDVMDILDNKTIGVRVGHYQQLGFQVAKPGDKVGFVRLKDSFHAYHTMTVKSLEVINGRYHRLTFVEDLPSELKAGVDLVENLSAYPEVLVEGCDISLNRARGILVSTPVKTTIRNNYFNTDMTAILLPVESSSWYESGNATNVIIENNVFQDCVVGGSNTPVIRFHTDDDSPSIAFKNIRIENNTFNQYDNYILAASNIDGLVFKGNTIKNSGTYPQLFPSQAAITIQYCKNVKFENNKYEGKAKDIIKLLNGQEPVDFK